MRTSAVLLLLCAVLGRAAAEVIDGQAAISGVRAKLLKKHPLLSKHLKAPPAAVSAAPGSSITPTTVPAACLSAAELAQQNGNFSVLLAAAQASACLALLACWLAHSLFPSCTPFHPLIHPPTPSTAAAGCRPGLRPN